MNKTIQSHTDQNSQIIDVNEGDFAAQVIEASRNKIILVDFWAPWCGPCKQLSPTLEEIAKEAKGSLTLAKINIDENQQIAAQLRIQSIPTVMAFYEKKIVDAFQGVLPKQQIIQFIEKISGKPIQKDNSKFYTAIDNLITGKELDQARDLLDEFLGENSNDTKAISLYIRCLAELKNYDELEKFISALSEEVSKDQDIKSEIANFKMLRKSSKEPSLEKLLDAYNANPSNVENILKLSDKYFVGKEINKAFELLLNSFIIFKEKDKDKIKKTLLKYFDVLGNKHDLTKIYRRKLSSLIFS